MWNEIPCEGERIRMIRAAEAGRDFQFEGDDFVLGAKLIHLFWREETREGRIHVGIEAGQVHVDSGDWNSGVLIRVLIRVECLLVACLSVEFNCF